MPAARSSAVRPPRVHRDGGPRRRTPLGRLLTWSRCRKGETHPTLGRRQVWTAWCQDFTVGGPAIRIERFPQQGSRDFVVLADGAFPWFAPFGASTLLAAKRLAQRVVADEAGKK